MKCSNSGVEAKTLARARSVNVAWELYIGTWELGRLLVSAFVLPVTIDFQFWVILFILGKCEPGCLVHILHHFPLRYSKMIRTTFECNSRAKLINKREFTLNFASIRVHFCVIEMLQCLLTLTLCKNPLSLFLPVHLPQIGGLISPLSKT